MPTNDGLVPRSETLDEPPVFWLTEVPRPAVPEACLGVLPAHHNLRMAVVPRLERRGGKIFFFFPFTAESKG